MTEKTAVEFLEELLNRASQAPWSLAATGLQPRGQSYDDSIISGDGETVILPQDEQGGESWSSNADAELIVAMRNSLPEILEDLRLHREAYEAWRKSGSAAHAALLEIWHMAEREDTSHLTYGEDVELVVEAVRTELRRHREELREKQIEAFELVIEASEELEGDEPFSSDAQNSSPEWRAGYRASARDLTEYLKQKVTALRSA